MSEIILQQTRVDQGLPYWERFITTFPTITDLAKASEEQVLRLWQGLGYYSRARNLHSAAKDIAENLNGEFPNTHDDIIKLKGVGPYTAAAIASICFNEPKPVVDGNVFRFASRFFGIEADISKSGTRKIFEDRLRKVIPSNEPGTFNQAMMEFGATTCAPKPDCQFCDFSTSCYAYANNLQKSLPVKTGKTKVRHRFFNYIVLKTDGMYHMKARTAKDVWSGLYDFHLLEGEFAEAEVLDKFSEEIGLQKLFVEEISEVFLHILSHQKITARFYLINLPQEDSLKVVQKTGVGQFSVEEMLNLPKPKLIVNYLEYIGIK